MENVWWLRQCAEYMVFGLFEIYHKVAEGAQLLCLIYY